MKRQLQADGWEYNSRCDSFNKGNTRIYWDDIDIIVIRFTGNGLIQWKNRIDGNMPVDAKKKLIDMMEAL